MKLKRIIYSSTVCAFMLSGCGDRQESASANTSNRASQPATASSTTSPSTGEKKQVAKATITEPKPICANHDATLAAAQTLGKTLKGKLIGAMKSGGIDHAVNICANEAFSLSEQVAEESGVRVGRTSSKLRNPKNEAPDWVAQWLRENPTPQKWTPHVVDSPQHSRVIIPLKTAGPCTACHGKKIGPEIEKTIKKYYPDDHATGFAEGDLRGVIWAESKCSARQEDAQLEHTQQTKGDKVMIEIEAIPYGREVSEGVFASGQPSLDQIRTLKEQGLKTLINTRSVGELLVAEEEALAKELGIHYVHIPVNGAAGVTLENAQKLDAALGENTPMLIHCGSSNRVGALFALRENKLKGGDVEASIQIGQKAGLLGLEDHVRSLIED